MLTITVRFDNLVTDDAYTLDYTFDGDFVKDAFRKVDEMAMEHSFKTNGLSDGNYEIVSIKGDRFSVSKAISSEVKLALDYISDTDTYTAIDLHNAVAEDVRDYDRILWSMDDFNELMHGKTPLEIIGSVADEFNSNADWFYVNGLFCGFIKSCEEYEITGLLMDDAEDITYSLLNGDYRHLESFDALALLIEYADAIEIVK